MHGPRATRVLLVTDQPELRRTLETALALEGCEVLVSSAVPVSGSWDAVVVERRDAAVEACGVRVDRDAHRAWQDGRLLELTPTEFALLADLVTHADRVRTRTELHLSVWSYDFGPRSNALGVYVGYLRRKLEAEGAPRLIQTVRGVGYAFRP